MFVDHDLWPPPPSEPPALPPRRMTEAEERRLGWAIAAFVTIMFAGPLTGSSIVEAVVAVVRSVVSRS